MKIEIAFPLRVFMSSIQFNVLQFPAVFLILNCVAVYQKEMTNIAPLNESENWSVHIESGWNKFDMES